MGLNELIDLHSAISSICKDADEIFNGNFDIKKMKKLDADLNYVKGYLEGKLMEYTSIKKESLSTQTPNEK